jgi:membrane associated rhomboid family serine protease
MSDTPLEGSTGPAQPERPRETPEPVTSLPAEPLPGPPIPVSRPPLVPTVRLIADPKPPPPRPFPWATIVAALLIVGGATAFKLWRLDLFSMTKLSHACATDVGSWWRLVAVMFTHKGEDQIFPCLIALSLVAAYGFRAERAFGTGGMLFCYLVAGALANLVRCGTEPDAWLQVSTGSVAGGVALVGAATSASVRRKEVGFVTALRAGFVSVLFAALFTVTQGISIVEGMKFMLPGIGAAFFLGGLLGGLVPLYEAGKRRLARGLLLLVSLAIFGASAVPVIRQLVPAERGVKNPKVDGESKGAVLQPHSDEKLGYDFGMPIQFGLKMRPRDNPRFLVYAPYYTSIPRIDIFAVPRGPLSGAADTFAEWLAQRIRDEDPHAAPLKDGPLKGCSLGPASWIAVRANIGGNESVFWICVAETKEEFVCVRIQTEPDDDTAEGLMGSIARSLKVRAPTADKEEGSDKGSDQGSNPK